jgi:hypothetical protein
MIPPLNQTWKCQKPGCEETLRTNKEEDHHLRKNPPKCPIHDVYMKDVTPLHPGQFPDNPHKRY